MSTQKFQNDDGNGVTRDDKVIIKSHFLIKQQAEESSEEHLYEDSVFETSKKIKKENEQNQAGNTLKPNIHNFY